MLVGLGDWIRSTVAQQGRSISSKIAIEEGCKAALTILASSGDQYAELQLKAGGSNA
ncbi:MAG: hypothetical protein ACJ8LM_07095 [Candidatus Udaeobacter sp.]